MSVKIGKAKFGGGGYVKRKWWKLKDGESVFRILPPLGKLADSGRWSVFYNVHFGYSNTNGEMRTFQSPLVKNRKTRMVEVPDAALDRIDKIKGQEAAAKAAGNKELEKKLGLLLQKYNMDNNYYVNAMDEQGNIGILKIRHRCKLALDAIIAKLRAQNVDPLDADSGRFFVFTRSGSGLDTTFQVSVKQNKRVIEGVGEVYQDVVHALTPDILGRLEAESAELDNLFRRPSSEEVALIVSSSDLMTGKSPAVDEFLDAKPEAAAPEGEDGPEADEPQQAAAAPTLAPVKPLAPVAPLAVAATPAPAVTPAKPVPAPSVPKTTAQVVTNQSDEEFLKSMNL